MLQVHLAEDGADVRDARERGYEGPLQRLMALGALPPGSILVARRAPVGGRGRARR